MTAVVVAVALNRSSPGAGPGPSTQVVKTTLPGLAPATGEPELFRLAALHPAPGTVVQAKGPFDDRFALRDLRLDAKGVHAKALITSDVSDILEFAAVAGFYDADGHLLGTGRFTYHFDEGNTAPRTGPPNEVESFRIAVPAPLQGKVSSAAVGVPVLVNE